MKDIIKRIVISFVSGGLLGYLAYLFVNKSIIVRGEFIQYNTLYYIVLAVACIYLFVFFGIYPIYLKMTKATLFVCGIALIVIGDTVLLNNYQNSVYVGDLFKLLGVILTLLAWTDLLVTDKVLKQKSSSSAEIIEV